MKAYTEAKSGGSLRVKDVAAPGRQVVWYEDDFTVFVKKNWETLGLTPVFLNLLVHKGWWAELVDECFSELVGIDYADIKMTEWIERLKIKGYEFPRGKPVLQALNEILIETWDGESDDLPVNLFNGLN
mgnify:CR=1 FL=1